MSAGHLLVVEDDEFVQSLLSAYLEKEGFKVWRAMNGREMLCLLSQERIDLILLDLTLPDEDGLTLARQVRARSMIPIIVLTARTERHDRLAALEIGADDYMVKPFDPQELCLRIRNLLNRAGTGDHGMAYATGRNRDKILFEGFTLDLAGHTLLDQKGKQIILSPAEFNLLSALAHAPGRVLSRSQLLDAVSRNDEPPSERLIDVLISRLRRKLAHPALIVTAPGLGYRFSARLA
ncbi:MAG: response regulator transcription factor [Alphaproteobacteria bacterium]|nr:response regulator transcription factor [Alphaproteobacteria bacterium]